MSDRDPTVSDLVQRSVNKHGELHLDRERTETLLAWLRAQETYIENTNANFERLQKLIKPLIERRDG